MVRKPSKEEQIEALIHHRAYDLVMECAPSEDISDAEAYALVFTVKRREVLEYLVQRYNISDLIKTELSNRDGFYAIPVSQGFRVYEQYNCIKAMEKILSDELGVWNEFVSYILGTSGTGLDFK